ncbi:class I SAM-dependent methyltransferase family protein [Streptomyces sulfonofaciens]|nr:class I SAM-dependent methyltransferase family protein [Streptomyces sulfonofaciens]
MDWESWHGKYDDPASPMTRRLRVVQERIRLALDAAPKGPLRAVSICAGQGRDLVGVLAEHPRGPDVTARLVELDARNAAVAAESARAAGLDRVEVVTGDAARTDHYRGLVPADLVLLCGLFGNISDADVERTIGYTTQLCAPGGRTIWTRHRRAPDLVPRICAWFRAHGHEPEFVSEPDAGFGVGVHRFTGVPAPLEEGARMFSFIGFDVLRRLNA